MHRFFHRRVPWIYLVVGDIHTKKGLFYSPDDDGEWLSACANPGRVALIECLDVATSAPGKVSALAAAAGRVVEGNPRGEEKERRRIRRLPSFNFLKACRSLLARFYRPVDSKTLLLLLLQSE